MTPERLAPAFLALFVAMVAVASGPLVPATDLTPAGDFSVTKAGFFDGGEVDVEKRLSFAPEPLPKEGHIDRAGTVHVPDATLSIQTGSKPATVRYAVSIPELNYTRSTSLEVPAGRSQTLVVPLPEGDVPREELTEEAYEARLVVTVTHDGQTYEATRGNATVEVEG